MTQKIFRHACGLGLVGLLAVVGSAEAAAVYDLSARIGVTTPSCPLNNLTYCLNYEYLVNQNETVDSASSSVNPVGSVGSSATAKTSGSAAEMPHFADGVPTLPDRGDHTFGPNTWAASVAAYGKAVGTPDGVTATSQAAYSWGFEVLNGEPAARNLELLLEWDYDALISLDEPSLDGVTASILLEANGVTLASIPLSSAGHFADSGFSYVTVTVPGATGCNGLGTCWGHFIFDMTARVAGRAASVSETVNVPEPGTLTLLLGAALPLVAAMRRRNRR